MLAGRNLFDCFRFASGTTPLIEYEQLVVNLGSVPVCWLRNFDKNICWEVGITDISAKKMKRNPDINLTETRNAGLKILIYICLLLCPSHSGPR